MKIPVKWRKSRDQKTQYDNNTQAHDTYLSPLNQQHPQQYPTYFPIDRTNEQDANRENRDGERERVRER